MLRYFHCPSFFFSLFFLCLISISLDIKLQSSSVQLNLGNSDSFNGGTTTVHVTSTPIVQNQGHMNLKGGVTQRSAPITSLHISCKVSQHQYLQKGVKSPKPTFVFHFHTYCDPSCHNCVPHWPFSIDCLLQVRFFDELSIDFDFSCFLQAYTKIHIFGGRGTRSCIRLHVMGVLAVI